MDAAEVLGLALYPLALGLALSFFLPYVLAWAGVPLPVVFTVVPVAVAVVIYLVASRLLAGRGALSTYLPLLLMAVPVLLFPNLRVHSTFWDRIAPSLAKAALAAAVASVSAAGWWSVERLGVAGTLVSFPVLLVLAVSVSSLLFPPAPGDLGSPWTLSTMCLLAALLSLSAAWEGRA